MAQRIVLRHDTQANWSSVGSSVILSFGEAGVEHGSDGKIRLKIGDGSTVWNSLPYLNVDSLSWSKLTDIPTEVSGLSTTLAKSYVAAASVVTNGNTKALQLSLKRLSDDNVTTSDVTLPLASDSQPGLMAKEDFIAIRNLEEQVEALKGVGTMVDAHDFGNAVPTQSALTTYAVTWAAGQTPALGWTDSTLPNGVQVINTFDNTKWIYNAVSDTWVNAGGTNISTFTVSSAGLIKGVADDGSAGSKGKIFPENDGTGSVIGWSNLVTDVANIRNDLDTLTGDGTGSIGELEDRVTELEAGKQKFLVAGPGILKDTVDSSQDSIAVKLESDGGLDFSVSGGLKVVGKQDSLTAGDGIALTGSTISADIATSGGLKFTSNKLALDIKPNGGIALDSGQLKNAMTGGNGIAVSADYAVSVSTKANSGLSFDGGLLQVLLAAGGGLSFVNGGLSVVGGTIDGGGAGTVFDASGNG